MSDETEDKAPEQPLPEVAEDGPPEALLTPLEGEDPCGENLRYEGTFDAVREERRDEDPSLPQGVWETDVKRADWTKVEHLCQKGLAEKSKDLHLALWLTEAWTHLQGLRGFRRGIDLTCSLMEEYWADLHPKIDDDGDLDYRLGPLRWASEHFPVMLRLVPITQPAGADAVPMRQKDWEDVLRIENLQQRDPAAAKKEQARYPTRTAFESSVELTPVEHFLHLVPVAEACLGELERLDLILEEQCPKDAPSLARIRAVLVELETTLRGWMEQKGGVLPGDAEDDLPLEEDVPPTGNGEEEASAMTTQPASGGGNAGPIQTRAEAYRRLSEAADFLIRTEPHSPVPYLVKRAVSWGNLSFGELLVELIEGGGDHQRILRLLGLDGVGKKGK